MNGVAHRTKPARAAHAIVLGSLLALTRPGAAGAQASGLAPPTVSVPPTDSVPPTESVPRPESPRSYADLPALEFHNAFGREHVATRVYRDDGSLDPATMASLGHLLRDRVTGTPAPVVPRTIRLLVRIATHFHASRIDVVSGYRTGRNARGHRVHREGYHGEGSAIDFRVVGVDTAAVAAYARTFAHVGVGYYPSSDFVHLDSRQQTFFWENRSGRRHHGWDRPLDRSGVRERERRWTAADDAPWDAPGAEITLNLHPETQAGARSGHRHGRHRHRHGRHRRRIPLTVFSGEDG